MRFVRGAWGTQAVTMQSVSVLLAYLFLSQILQMLIQLARDGSANPRPDYSIRAARAVDRHGHTQTAIE